MHSPVREQAVGGILFGALAVVPFIAAYSVLFDHIVDLKVVLGAAIQYALARLRYHRRRVGATRRICPRDLSAARAAT